ncbi:hypothetical protein [Nocardioides sp.]|uniref:hypothetical protein n=1 Tax=Nocardioides sp. TaxID=35761 RepID=UPI0035B2BF6A
MPHQSVVSLEGRLSVTVMPVAVAPTTPVQHQAAEVLALLAAGTRACWVQVTDPPDADGVTAVWEPPFSREARTMMMSPAVTSNDVVVLDVAVDEKLPVDGAL